MTRKTYVPALDGVRALCVLAVLCFHAGFDWAGGGFLGVSTFFTLSGFLVTGLLFDELDVSRSRIADRPGTSGGRIDLAAFWQRRMRRLVPAALATLLGVTLAAPLLLGPEALARLGADVLASLVYLVNWRFVQADYGYSLIFSAPSWVQHFWSLAIEGQLYLVLPLVAAWSARTASPGRNFGRVMWVLLAAGTALSFVLGADGAAHDRIYYGTDTRAPELFAGSLLALAMRRHPLESGRRTGPALDVLGAASLVAILVLWNRVGLDTPGLHRGGLLVYAALSAAAVAACVRGTVVSRLLSWRVLVWIGRVSYGAYLFHWPIYLALDALFDEPDPLLRLGVGGGLTFALAGLSHAWLETPARRGQGLFGRRVGRSTALAMFATTGIVLLLLPTRPVLEELGLATPLQTGVYDDLLELERHSKLPSVAIFGDSVAYSFSTGISRFLAQNDEFRFVKGLNLMGCGLLLPAHLRAMKARGEDIERWTVGRNRLGGTRQHCIDYIDLVRGRVAANRPDLALVLTGTWDLPGVPDADRPDPVPLQNPVVAQRAREAMDELVEVLSAQGAQVVWLTLPQFSPGKRFSMSSTDSEAARQYFNGLVRELPVRWPGIVSVIDLEAHVNDWPDGPSDPALREDGLHFTRAGAFGLVERGLGEEILSVFEGRSARAAEAHR